MKMANFFPLMGGLYWKRATREGAVAAMVLGGGVQVVLVIVDLVKTAPMTPPFLETLHPIIMGHGVILGMGLSAADFIKVSLATRPVAALIRVPSRYSINATTLSVNSGCCGTPVTP